MSEKNSKPGRDTRGRFAKGTSPNPKGRPKKVPERTVSPLDVLFTTPVELRTAGGVTRKMSAADAARHAVFQEAFKGKAAAINRITEWVIRREKWRAKRTDDAAQKKRAETSTTRFVHDQGNVNDALLLLGIATRDEEYEASVNRPGYRHLKLEPWIVQKALGRRRSAVPFRREEIKEIERCARVPEEIRWPQGARE